MPNRTVASFPLSALLITGALLMPAAGCDTADLEERGFTIRVDSITGPSSVLENETLRVLFHGRIGPNLCWSLDEVVSGRAPNLLEVRFLGRHVNGSCPQMPSLLLHQEQILAPRVMPFTIRARQPTGPDLEKIVVNRP